MVVVVVVIVEESFMWVVYVMKGKGFGFGVLTTRVVGRSFFHDPMCDIGVLGESSKMSF